jgi:hypothetical protein
MGKDAAAELVSWWLTADEDERKMVEQQGFLKNTEKICCYQQRCLTHNFGKECNDEERLYF